MKKSKLMTGLFISSAFLLIGTQPTHASKKAGWQKENGSWSYYQNQTPQIGWLHLGNSWYFLDNHGVMKAGWQKVNQKWYFFNASGKMQTGWIKPDHRWFYLSPSGAMLTGWQKIGSSWYFLNSNGEMAQGWKFINNHWYYLNTSGKMQTGWLALNGKWYFLDASGKMQTGFVTVGKSQYYFYSSGVMATSSLQLNGKKYQIQSNGKILPDTAGEKIIETYKFSTYYATITEKDYAIFNGLYRHDLSAKQIGNTTSYLNQSVKVLEEVKTPSGRFAKALLNGQNVWLKKAALYRDDVAAQFVTTIKKYVEEATTPYDQFPSVLLAQAILESGYGQSELSSKYHNYFGIKAKKGYTGKVVTLPTKEWDAKTNTYYTIQADFKHYDSMLESFADRCRFIEEGGNTGNPNFYRPAFKSVAKTYQKATAYLSGRYATAPDYHIVLNQLIAFWELDCFD